MNNGLFAKRCHETVIKANVCQIRNEKSVFYIGYTITKKKRKQKKNKNMKQNICMIQIWSQNCSVRSIGRWRQQTLRSPRYAADIY